MTNKLKYDILCLRGGIKGIRENRKYGVFGCTANRRRRLQSRQ
nr:MAG TPA: hypothetical protein [Bacteriophage sp.]